MPRLGDRTISRVVARCLRRPDVEHVLSLRGEFSNALPSGTVSEPSVQRRSILVLVAAETGTREYRVGVQQFRAAFVKRRQPERPPKLLERRAIGEGVRMPLAGDSKRAPHALSCFEQLL